MADQNEEPARPELPEAAIGDDQGERDGKARHGERQHDGLLDEAGDGPALARQHIGGGHADHQHHREAGERDDEREIDGLRI